MADEPTYTIDCKSHIFLDSAANPIMHHNKKKVRRYIFEGEEENHRNSQEANLSNLIQAQESGRQQSKVEQYSSNC